MLTAILRLCLCFALGEMLSVQFGVPLPASVLGLCLFALWLLYRGGVCGETRSVFDAVMPHYGMLYVPAGVGILAHASSLPTRAIPLIAGVVVGTVVTVVATGLFSEALVRALGLSEEPETVPPAPLVAPGVS